MKLQKGMILILFSVVIVLGITQPALPFGCQQSGGGFFWDTLVDKSPYTGTKLVGTISVYYDPVSQSGCNGSTPAVDLLFTVRLTKGFEIYIFKGSAVSVCLINFEAHKNSLLTFFNTVVIPGIFVNGYQSWKVKSIDNAKDSWDFTSSGVFEKGAFVGDIQIAVKE